MNTANLGGTTFDTHGLLLWMRANVADFEGPFKLEKFAGGQSNPTFALDAKSGRYVLRRKPMGNHHASAHAVDREYRLLTALHPEGFPVPRPIAYTSDETIIGSAFYVMDRVDGQTHWNGALPNQDRGSRRVIYYELVETLARLHSIDPEKIGLADYGRPGNYFGRQIDRWTKQYRASQTEDVPEIDKLIEWLPRTVPDQTSSSIIHGDYRIDNLIFDNSTQKVAAVLDWELSTLGDPLADFSYFGLNWVLPADGLAPIGGIDLDAAGIPSLEEMTDHYCHLSGRARLENPHWYFAFSLFRVAGIVQGIRKRILDGTASSEAADLAASKLVPLAQAGWKQARLAGAVG
jgi:aminoglycoside phosphotransferase (APT) family kinase protein